jgi:hypothetical protein
VSFEVVVQAGGGLNEDCLIFINIKACQLALSITLESNVPTAIEVALIQRWGSPVLELESFCSESLNHDG